MAKGEIVPGNAAAPEADGPDAADRDDAPVPAIKAGRAVGKSPVPRPGFFTIYKRGQGKWTRLGTAFAAAALGLLTAYNIYLYAQVYLPIENPVFARKMLILACVAFLIVFTVVAFWASNKPRNVDFLIATDSEMKKVNWTTQGELYGSTRVVVLFLFCVAVFLFAVDLVFAKFFHLIRVLQ